MILFDSLKSDDFAYEKADFGGLSTECAKRNICVSLVEVSLVNALSRETLLKRYTEMVKDSHNLILSDCMPLLGMISIHALVAADSVLIPVQAHYLPTKDMTQLIQTDFIGVSTSTRT